MIASVEGRIAGRGANSLVVDVGGIGLRILVPQPLLTAARPGELVQLFTHLIVREDELTLVGFATQDELTLFEHLITVTGVGPRLALALLSGMAPDSLRLAIGQEQPEVIARIPGIGKKTAERMLLELRDRAADFASGQGGGASLRGDAISEAITALQALGYKPAEAERMAKKVAAEGDEAPAIIRKALQAALR